MEIGDDHHVAPWTFRLTTELADTSQEDSMSTVSRTRLLITVLLAAVLMIPASGIAAQATPEADTTNPFSDLGLPQLDITITDDAFEGIPAELDAGRYIIAISNATSGEFPEGGLFVQMTDDITTEEFLDFVATPPNFPDGVPRPQPWFYETVRTGAPYVLPGETRYAVIDLTAGDWVFAAEYRVAPQSPVPVTVTGELPADLPTPDADVAVEMSEFDISYSGALRSGPQILEVTNVGTVPHFYALFRIPDGATTEEYQAFTAADIAASSGMPATPVTTGPLADATLEDIEFVVGTAVQSAGATAWYAIDLEPGTYAAECFQLDLETEQRHVVLGEVEVTVVD
jgi:hypothetical protein